MIQFLQLGFPISYFTLAFGFILGITITLITASFLTGVILLFLIYSGSIRILPLLELIQPFIPNFSNEIKNSFQVKSFLEKNNNKNIVLFHPHGAFSASYFFHTMTDVTDFPDSLKKGKKTVLRYLYWLPFGKEILDNLGAVPNYYKDMKKVLDSGENLFVIPGGIREMYECAATSGQKGVLRLKLKERTGVFRLALETGTPLVPVLSYGENELYSLLDFPFLRKIQKWLEKFDLILPIPSFTSVQKWYSVLQGSFKNSILTVIGDSVEVEKKTNISSEDIELLKQKYMDVLQELYSKTKPENYSEKIIFL